MAKREICNKREQVLGVQKRAGSNEALRCVRALVTNSPPSVSCHTMPSSVTDVPGSHGPRQSGSVIVPTDVPTHTSAVSWKKRYFSITQLVNSNSMV